MLRKLRRLCQPGPVLLLVLVTGLFVAFAALFTDFKDVENIVWTSMGAVVNCSSYEKAASRALQVHVGFYSGLPEGSTFNATSITLVTQLSFNRLAALVHVIQQWDGPISAAVYLKKQELPSLRSNLSSQPPGLLDRTTVHTVIDDGDAYPINFLRNVALNHSVSEHVFLNDVDFIPVLGLHDYLLRNIHNGVMRSKDVFVIPAFMFNAELPLPDFPTNKNQLLELVGSNVFCGCRVAFGKRPAQCPTNYETWYTATRPYVVTYVRGFEPYIVMRRTDTPPYDEGFVGREMDKISHLLEVHARGNTFVVLPDVFIIHYPHPRVGVIGSSYWCPRIHFVDFENRLREKFKDTFRR